MTKLGWAALGAAVLVATACADRSDPVSPGRMAPRAPRATLAANATGPIAGAIFTTDQPCTGTNINIFGAKTEVYIDGGPAHTGAAGLPAGQYAVKVTTPDGTLLGTSLGTTDEDPVVVGVNGEFAACYQLMAILRKASTDVTGGPVAPDGYETTTNPGGEYKVWVSNGADFAAAGTKTDNFKVKDTECTDCGPLEIATLNVVKFYDANANGLDDDGQAITGWKVNIRDGMNLDRFTPASLVVAPDDYTVTEYASTVGTWINTTTNPVLITLANGDNATVKFGNVCLAAGGGLTLGFWSNINGKNTMGTTGIPFLNNLDFDADAINVAKGYWRTATGARVSYPSNNFGFKDYATFRTWILNATATNMAYMLSAQLAAMELNVRYNLVNASALIYAPGTSSANTLGFATVSAVMDEALAILWANGASTLNIDSVHPLRARAEAVKIALDKANNNLNFVQGTPCAFSFASGS